MEQLSALYALGALGTGLWDDGGSICLPDVTSPIARAGLKLLGGVAWARLLGDALEKIFY